MRTANAVDNPESVHVHSVMATSTMSVSMYREISSGVTSANYATASVVLYGIWKDIAKTAIQEHFKQDTVFVKSYRLCT